MTPDDKRFRIASLILFIRAWKRQQKKKFWRELAAYVLLVIVVAFCFYLVSDSINSINRERSERSKATANTLLYLCTTGNTLRTKLRNFLTLTYNQGFAEDNHLVQLGILPKTALKQAESVGKAELSDFDKSFANLKCESLPTQTTTVHPPIKEG